MTGDPRLFVGIFPGGKSYCDRTREKDGDYVKLAFLPYDTLALVWYSASASISKRLFDEIEADALAMQRRRGDAFQISATGQTVILGSRT